MMRKLKVQADHPSTDPNTASATRVKLEGYCERFGINEQSLVVDEDKPSAVGMTRREIKEAIIKAVFRSPNQKKAQAFLRAALEAAYDDEDLKHTLQQTKEYL